MGAIFQILPAIRSGSKKSHCDGCCQEIDVIARMMVLVYVDISISVE